MGEVRQNERQNRKRGEHGKVSARALDLEILLPVLKAACENAKADNAIANDHDHREDRVAGKRRVALAAERDRHDERHLDDRHGDGQHERPVGLA